MGKRRFKKGHPDGAKIGGRHKSATDLGQKVILFVRDMKWVTKVEGGPIKSAPGGRQLVSSREVVGGLRVTARMAGSIQKIMVHTSWPARVAQELGEKFK